MASTKSKSESGKAKGKGGGKIRRPMKRKVRKRYTAEGADKYELYQLAVQSPEADVDFLVETYRQERKKIPHVLREDFCGTALLCSHWVKQGPNYSAIGYDLDPEPIEWGLKHNIEPLGVASDRVQLFVEDCRVEGEKADIRVAHNFSYSLFHKREELLAYFKTVYDSLGEDGMFSMDMYGGPESTDEMEEEREIDEGFTYVWDQYEFWPGTSEFSCKIHFLFPDGSEMRNAFEYEWRVWYMSELKDMLAEVGFSKVQSYFEGDDEDSEEGDGNFEADDRGDNCAAWIAYLVALK